MNKGFFRKGIVFGIIFLFVGAGVIPLTVGINKEKTQILNIGFRGFIQELIDNASDGDTIFIPSGIYFETIVIDKSINLVGEDKNTTIIDGFNGHDSTIQVIADWVNVSGFTIKNASEWGESINGGIKIVSNYNSIIGNKICYNYGEFWPVAGIVLDGSYNYITDNYFNFNQRGIGSNFAEKDSRYASYNTIFNNEFSNNECGISMLRNSNNTIYHNNFVENLQNAYDDFSNTWDDNYPSGGNYWDDYNGTDSDEDGIGDTPYSISGGNNEDRYPLMNPTCNVPPYKPIIDGPISGKPNNEYEFSFNTTDLNDDSVMYIIQWGDNNTEWTEYSNSGEEIMLKHNWSEKGDYTIKVKAKDIHGAMSDWSEFEVIIPRTKTTSYLWYQWFLERFPLFERLLTLLLL